MRYALPTLLACGLLLGGHAFADDEGPTLSLSFEDTPVREIVATIAKFAGANVIIPSDVDAKVTLTLHDVPWRSALEQVAGIAGCTLVEEEHGILRLVRAAQAEAVLGIYDVSDLLEDETLVLPLPATLGAAEVKRAEGNLIVRATPLVQEKVARELERLRYERARKAVGFDFQMLVAHDVSEMPVLAPLALKTSIYATHTARARLRAANLSPTTLEGLELELALDLLRQRATIEWVRVNGVVHLLAPGESPDETVAVFSPARGAEGGWAAVAPFAGRRNDNEGSAANDVAAQLAALRKELRALRAEVAEIKALLQRDDR